MTCEECLTFGWSSLSVTATAAVYPFWSLHDYWCFGTQFLWSFIQQTFANLRLYVSPYIEDTEINQTRSLSFKTLQLVEGQKIIVTRIERMKLSPWAGWAEWRWHLSIKYAFNWASGKGKEHFKLRQWHKQSWRWEIFFLVGKRQEDHYRQVYARSHGLIFRGQVGNETWVEGQHYKYLERDPT